MTRDELDVIIAADWAAFLEAVERDRDRWWIRRRELPDGRVIHLQRMAHFYRVSVSPPDTPTFDHVYDYEADETAWTAFLTWDGKGDPDGWYRHPQSGRYRPGGDASREQLGEPA